MLRVTWTREMCGPGKNQIDYFRKIVKSLMGLTVDEGVDQANQNLCLKDGTTKWSVSEITTTILAKSAYYTPQSARRRFYPQDEANAVVGLIGGLIKLCLRCKKYRAGYCNHIWTSLGITRTRRRRKKKLKNSTLHTNCLCGPQSEQTVLAKVT